MFNICFFFFSSRRRHTSSLRDWSSDVCSSDLLLDEPTVGLDIASRQFMLDHVRRLCREEGLAALWATHLIDEVGDGARVVVLHRGEVRAAGAAEQLLGQTRTPTMRAAFETLVQDREAA